MQIDYDDADSDDGGLISYLNLTKILLSSYSAPNGIL